MPEELVRCPKKAVELKLSFLHEELRVALLKLSMHEVLDCDFATNAHRFLSYSVDLGKMVQIQLYRRLARVKSGKSICFCSAAPHQFDAFTAIILPLLEECKHTFSMWLKDNQQLYFKNQITNHSSNIFKHINGWYSFREQVLGSTGSWL